MDLSCGGKAEATSGPIPFNFVNDGSTAIDWTLSVGGGWSASLSSGQLPSGYHTEISVQPTATMCSELAGSGASTSDIYADVQWPGKATFNGAATVWFHLQFS